MKIMWGSCVGGMGSVMHGLRGQKLCDDDSGDAVCMKLDDIFSVYMCVLSPPIVSFYTHIII